MKQEISKLVGYATIEIGGESLPLKFGFASIRSFCEHFKIKPGQIMSTLFEYIEDEEGQPIPIVKDMLSFLPVLLWAGADYVNRFNGGQGFRLLDADNWIDEIGGPTSPQLGRVYAAFFAALANGATPAPPEQDEKKNQTSPQSS